MAKMANGKSKGSASHGKNAPTPPLHTATNALHAAHARTVHIVGAHAMPPGVATTTAGWELAYARKRAHMDTAETCVGSTVRRGVYDVGGGGAGGGGGGGAGELCGCCASPADVLWWRADAAGRCRHVSGDVKALDRMNPLLMHLAILDKRYGAGGRNTRQQLQGASAHVKPATPVVQTTTDALTKPTLLAPLGSEPRTDREPIALNTTAVIPSIALPPLIPGLHEMKDGAEEGVDADATAVDSQSKVEAADASATAPLAPAVTVPAQYLEWYNAWARVNGQPLAVVANELTDQNKQDEEEDATKSAKSAHYVWGAHNVRRNGPAAVTAMMVSTSAAAMAAGVGGAWGLRKEAAKGAGAGMNAGTWCSRAPQLTPLLGMGCLGAGGGKRWK
ncbi:hypothetical protein HDU82_008578 [Entophlyctis luteolus]|nr:hypothetical protein HDU82_008578 [Entophlyctis luteolus]